MSGRVRPWMRSGPAAPALLAAAAAALAFVALPVSNVDDDLARVQAACQSPTRAPDLTGCPRVGVASIYAKHFNGRVMADGARLDLSDDVAASKTLPLGTTARVTNLDTGQSTVVTIRDRGPYVHGRIVDLSTSAARKVGLTPHQGLARVEVAPIEVPLPGGAVKVVTADDDHPSVMR